MIFKLFMSPLRHFSIKSFVLIDVDDEFFFAEWLNYKKPQAFFSAKIIVRDS